MNIIVVTGVNGFVGYHVATQLHSKGCFVLGIGTQTNLNNNLVSIVDQYISCDLTNANEVAKIDLTDITAIINLAGFAKVGDSRGQGELYNRVNVGVHSVLYEECIKQNVKPRVIAISTGAVYDPNQPMPITEDSALIAKESTNEYVVSKQLMEEAVANYRKKGLKVIIVRPFNHSGPGQLPGFLVPDLGEQILSARRENKPLLVGNLDTKRDYTDVRDVAKAYVELATCDEVKLTQDIYNICSGKSVKGTEILRLLTKAFEAEDLKVEIDPSRIRPNDVIDIFGSHDKLSNDTGWQPSIPLDQMINDYTRWLKSR